MIKNFQLVMMLVLGVSAQSFAGLADIQLKLQEYVPELQALDSQVINAAYSVGNDGACDFETIQEAIDAGADLVRITAGQYIENLVITNQSVNLQGNYANCEDANNDITSDVRAVVSSDFNGTVIMLNKTEAITQRNKISHLEITEGESNSGSGVEAFDIDLLVLSNVYIHNNFAVSGSGGGVNATNSRVYIKDSDIENNYAGIDGGGVRSNFTAIIDGQTKITNNTAENGGGFFGNAVIFSPVSFADNVSKNFGGAVVLNGHQSGMIGKQLCEGNYCFGLNSQPVCIIDNLSEQDGGGISFWGGESLVHNALIQGNFASEGGGALGIGNQSLSGLSRSVNISNSLIKGNRANSGVVAMLLGDTNSELSNLTIDNSVISNNGNAAVDGYKDLNLFFAAENASLSLNYNTVADNEITDELIHNTGADVSTSVISSIFDQSEMFYTGLEGASLSTACLLVKNLVGIIQPPASVQVGMAQFANALNGDYHLAADSPGIDFCSQLVEIEKDKDGKPRGFDDVKDDQFGTYDLGAYEYMGGEVIFEDGFEPLLPLCL